MKISIPQYSFTGGEVSRKMWGRADVPNLLNHSAATLQNMLPLVQGPAYRRPGTQFIGSAQDQTGGDNLILIPFVFNDQNAYLLECGPLYFKVLKNRSYVLTNSSTLTNGNVWTNTSIGTGTATWSSNIETITGNGAGNYGQATYNFSGSLNGTNLYQLVMDVGTTAVTVNIGTTSGASDIFSTTVQPGTGTQTNFESSTNNFYVSVQCLSGTATLANELINMPVVIVHTFASADIPLIRYINSSGILYITHPTKVPQQLTRASDTSWTLSNFVYNDGPYFDYSDLVYAGRNSGVTMTPSATTGSVTMTASSPKFVSTDVGRFIRYRHVNTALWGWGKITAFTSTTVVTVSIQSTFSGSVASSEWTLGAWSATTGYPWIVSSSQGRILFANTTLQPNGFWATASNSTNKMAPDNAMDDNVIASTAISTTIANAPNVLWLQNSGTRVYLGSSGDYNTGGVFSIDGVASGNTATGGITISPIDSAKSLAAKPIKVQGSACFISNTSQALFEVAYIYESFQEGYRVRNMSILADHLGINGFAELAYQNLPIPIIWVRRNDGVLVGCTYSKQDTVKAWHEHIIGGTNSFVRAISVIPFQTTAEDLYLIVERTINGTTKRFIEFVTPLITDATTTSLPFHVDCGLQYKGSPTTTLAGFTYIANQAVDVVADGYIVPNITVSATGTITLPVAASVITVGLTYSSQVATLRLEGGNLQGSAMGRKARISAVVIQFVQSNGAQVSYFGLTNSAGDPPNYNDYIYFNSNQIFGSGPALQSGYFYLEKNSGNLRSPQIVVQSTGGLSMNITSILTEVDAADW